MFWRKKEGVPHSHALLPTLSGFYTSEKGVIMTKSGHLLKSEKKIWKREVKDGQIPVPAAQ